MSSYGNKIKEEYSQLSIKITFPFFPTTHQCKVRLSSCASKQIFAQDNMKVDMPCFSLYFLFWKNILIKILFILNPGFTIIIQTK